MSLIEIGLIVGGLLGTITLCAVRILHQIQNSKCVNISCCGASCVRDVTVDLPEVETRDISTSITPRYSNETQERPILIKPQLEKNVNFTTSTNGNVNNLKKMFETKD
tara:strand:+ start:844 stop:1167 length:324 start_codon:yes stop_codon:yes gene_type:complete